MNTEKRVQRNQGIIADYNAGLKVRDIALKYELSEVSISKIINAGRVVGQVTLVSSRGASERNKQIASLYEEGMTMQAIATRCDLSRERVRQILSAQGVESRSVGEAHDAAHGLSGQPFNGLALTFAARPRPGDRPATARSA